MINNLFYDFNIMQYTIHYDMIYCNHIIIIIIIIINMNIYIYIYIYT